ncbi:uncharacterized protein isoform X2 [Bombus fervidus]|uniref:uncharacterized protein isoform X2 n=1 Tax=Bombus fervidus TaxID=203811 RepID=UPI003AB18269
MFSRAAKSIVKTIGQRKYHAGEENIKSAVIGGAGELGQSLSQMLKQTSKLDVLALYDVAALNKRYLTPMRIKAFKDSNTAANTANSRMLTMLEKSRSNKNGEHLQTPYFSNRVSNANQNATEELVRSLRQLPIAEECATNRFARPTMESQPQVTPDTLARHHQNGNAVQGVGRKRRQLRLGEPDCGEDPPDWPKKSPCHPPKGPCKPMGPPGYPAKPKPEKKPFCVKCPPKKPCKTKKC